MHQVGGADYRLVGWFTNSKINLAGFSTLYFDLKYDYNWNIGWPMKFGATSKKSYSAFESSSGDGRVYVSPSTSSERRTIAIDVSEINDSLYIGLSNSGRVWIYNVWLE